MDASRLLSFCGHSPSEPVFDAWLTANRVHDRPHTIAQDEAYLTNPDAAYENARASLIEEVGRASVCLIYEPRANYERLFGPPSDGDFILKQFAVYGPGVQDYPGHKGNLPFGLSLSDGQQAVRDRLGTPQRHPDAAWPGFRSVASGGPGS